ASTPEHQPRQPRPDHGTAVPALDASSSTPNQVIKLASPVRLPHVSGVHVTQALTRVGGSVICALPGDQLGYRTGVLNLVLRHHVPPIRCSCAGAVAAKLSSCYG